MHAKERENLERLERALGEGESGVIAQEACYTYSITRESKGLYHAKKNKMVYGVDFCANCLVPRYVYRIDMTNKDNNEIVVCYESSDKGVCCWNERVLFFGKGQRKIEMESMKRRLEREFPEKQVVVA